MYGAGYKLSYLLTGYISQNIWCLSQSRINWEGWARKGIRRKMVGMAAVGAPISQDAVAVHPDLWCVCLCYLHFAPENPEDDEQRYDIWVSPRGCPHMPTQTGGGEIQPNQYRMHKCRYWWQCTSGVSGHFLLFRWHVHYAPLCLEWLLYCWCFLLFIIVYFM